jgi:hypothetical protein
MSNDRRILHLPDARAQYGDRVVSYSRVTTPSQVTNGSLLQQKASEYRALRSLGLRVRAVVAECESGKVSQPRRHLLEAIRLASKHKAILVCHDLSRFIRSESFHHLHNWHCLPSPEEIARLLDLAGEVPLATRLDPTMSASDIHRHSTRRRRPGRPRSYDTETAKRMLEGLANGGSLKEVADDCGVEKGAVKRLLDECMRAVFLSPKSKR